jgi:H+-translocating NAD(P) transhydrogenase subunit alpha
MLIGIPKEILEEENRVASTPDTVQKYIKLGFQVLVETAAGQGIFKSDAEYAQAGATIAEDARSVFARADIILKVKQPAFNAAAGNTKSRCCATAPR